MDVVQLFFRGLKIFYLLHGSFKKVDFDDGPWNVHLRAGKKRLREHSMLCNGGLRKFGDFLAPGLQVRTTHISRDKNQFWKIDVILTIFGKSTIFQSPPKSVDECWHWRYKNFETANYSIITLQNIMKKIDDTRLMLKNTGGGRGEIPVQ